MKAEILAQCLMERMPDALVVSDAKGIIRHWNQGAERMFGFATSEAVGSSLDIIIPENLRERHWQGYDQTMRTGQCRYGAGDLLAVPAIRKDGSRISTQFSIFTITDADGPIAGVAAIMRDVTAEFEERKRLRKLAAAKRQGGP